MVNRAKIFAGKTAKTQFWPKIFHFFEQDRLLVVLLLFARFEIGVTEFPTKTGKKVVFFVSENFFHQKWVRIPRFFIFLAAEKR